MKLAIHKENTNKASGTLEVSDLAFASEFKEALVHPGCSCLSGRCSSGNSCTKNALGSSWWRRKALGAKRYRSSAIWNY